MDVGLTSEQLELRDTVREILRTEYSPDADRQALTDSERWRTLWNTVVDLGWTELAARNSNGDFGPVERAVVVQASAARIASTTCDQQVVLLFDVLGPTALDSGTSAPLHEAIEDHWRYAQAATVASGTIEVQRMLVARDALGEHR
jgi:alkylation response protein AidB-like acyl-CoA dehydrogenase